MKVQVLIVTDYNTDAFVTVLDPKTNLLAFFRTWIHLEAQEAIYNEIEYHEGGSVGGVFNDCCDDLFAEITIQGDNGLHTLAIRLMDVE